MYGSRTKYIFVQDLNVRIVALVGGGVPQGSPIPRWCVGIAPVNTRLYYTCNHHYAAPEYHPLVEFSVPL